MKNLDKYLSLLSGEVDGLLLTSRYSRHYGAEFDIAEGVAIVTKAGCRYFTDSRYIESAQNGIKGFEVLEMKRGYNYIQRLNDAIADFGVTKLGFEAQFQHLSPGGAISYVEVPNMQQNIDAVLELMQFIYDHILYAELNTKSDYCQCCGFDGEIEIREDDGKLVWTCPQCGNTDQAKMNVARRTCGYIGTQFWNQGRTQEIQDRVLHL